MSVARVAIEFGMDLVIGLTLPRISTGGFSSGD